MADNCTSDPIDHLNALHRIERALHALPTNAEVYECRSDDNVEEAPSVFISEESMREVSKHHPVTTHLFPGEHGPYLRLRCRLHGVSVFAISYDLDWRPEGQ